MNRIRYLSRRPACDVFHGDPFKIQSYNFRYADKPCYQPQEYPRPAPPPPLPERKPSFQTFFVNPKFARDPELPPLNGCVPSNRRRFLQEFQTVLTPPLRTLAPPVIRQPSVPVSPQLRCPSAVTDSPLLRTCCQSGEYLTLRRGQSFSTLGSASSSSMRATAGGNQSLSDTTFSRSSNVQLAPKRGAAAGSSGCEININICSLDSDSDSVDNNVSIRIKAEASLLNNKDTARPEQDRTPRRSDASLGVDFGIDKRLSKFNVTETKPRTSPEWDHRQRQRVRELAREHDRQLRQELELERERELEEERERVRQREREREKLRQQERQRDLEHLQELEAVREKQRLRELERESQRNRDFHRMCLFQEQLAMQRRLEPVRAMSAPLTVPMSAPLPVPMTSHLYTVTSDDRLPGMAYCDLSSHRFKRATSSRRSLKVKKTVPVEEETPTVCDSSSISEERPINARSPSPAPSSRLPSCTPITTTPSPEENALPIFTLSSSTPPRSQLRSDSPPSAPENLDRSSSCSSNGNVHVTGKSLTKKTSFLGFYEPKQLNGRPPIVTRLNNMPIRITTSRPADRDLSLTMNHVRVRNSSPMTRREGSHRRIQARQDACQVNINLYSDKLRKMRI